MIASLQMRLVPKNNKKQLNAVSLSSDENAAEQQLVAEVLQANLWTDSNTLQPKKIFPVAQALRVSSSDTVRQPAQGVVVPLFCRQQRLDGEGANCTAQCGIVFFF